jgi:hypothetical protein
MNHYQLLGIARNADSDQISQAYINLCKRYKSILNYGPDISFEMVQAAYKTLSDAESRRLYDGSLVIQDSKIQKNTVAVASVSESVIEGEWASKDYSGIKEWIHDFRIPDKPVFAQTADESFARASAPVVNRKVDYRKPPTIQTEKPSTSHKALMALLIFFAFLGIPAGAAFFTGLGLNSALAALYSLLGACVFSIACLKTSPANSVPTAKDVRKRRAYQNSNPKVQPNLTPAMRRNLMDAGFALKCKIWGMPGVLDDAVEKFGQHNVDLGTAGEELTAKLLEDLLTIPGTRIFHGLKFPGSQTADVDHAVINGDKIVFIDSKMWVGAHYKWVRPDTIGRARRKEFKEIHTNFPEAVRHLSQTFSKQQIMAMTIIHSNNNSHISFDNSNSSGVLLANGQDAIRDIGSWFSKDLTGKIDLNAMQKLEYQLKFG